MLTKVDFGKATLPQQRKESIIPKLLSSAVYHHQAFLSRCLSHSFALL